MFFFFCLGCFFVFFSFVFFVVFGVLGVLGLLGLLSLYFDIFCQFENSIPNSNLNFQISNSVTFGRKFPLTGTPPLPKPKLIGGILGGGGGEGAMLTNNGVRGDHLLLKKKEVSLRDGCTNRHLHSKKRCHPKIASPIDSTIIMVRFRVKIDGKGGDPTGGLRRVKGHRRVGERGQIFALFFLEGARKLVVAITSRNPETSLKPVVFQNFVQVGFEG